MKTELDRIQKNLKLTEKNVKEAEKIIDKMEIALAFILAGKLLVAVASGIKLFISINF